MAQEEQNCTKFVFDAYYEPTKKSRYFNFSNEEIIETDWMILFAQTIAASYIKR